MSSSSGRQRLVVKIGGSTLGQHDTTLEDLVTLQRRGLEVVVVHGGGQAVTEWLGRWGVETQFVRGLRVTDAESLKVVVAVLAGLVNKELVATLNALGGKAVGLSGADGRLIEAEVKDAALGYVGEVSRVNLEPVEALLQAGYLPVIASVGWGCRDDVPTLLNINADTVAGEMATALKSGGLVFLTDVEGVRNGEGRLLPRLSRGEAKGLIASGVVAGGMIPKVEACLKALSTPSRAVIIDGRRPHALLSCLEGHSEGTIVG